MEGRFTLGVITDNEDHHQASEDAILEQVKAKITFERGVN